MAFAARSRVFRRIRLARSAIAKASVFFLPGFCFFFFCAASAAILDPGLRMLVSCVISISYFSNHERGVDASKCE